MEGPVVNEMRSPAEAMELATSLPAKHFGFARGHPSAFAIVSTAAAAFRCCPQGGLYPDSLLGQSDEYRMATVALLSVPSVSLSEGMSDRLD